MELSYSGSGKVYYNSNEYRCDLYLNEKEGGILLKIIVNKGLASFVELPFKIDILQGELSTGFTFSVFDCSRQNMQNLVTEGRSVFTYIARSMLKGVGRENPDGINLYKVQFGLGNILEWGTYSAYKVGEHYELQSKEPIEIKIYEDDLVSIKYIVSASMLPVVDYELLKDEITISQQGIIEIQSKEPRLFRFFEDIFSKIRKLIEMSMICTVNLKNVNGWAKSVFDVFDEEQFEHQISIISAQLSCTKQRPMSRSWKWLTMPELMEKNSFQLFFEKYDSLEPVFELYMEIFTETGISNRRIFLNTVQALETYHSRFITNDLEEFKRRISNVILKNRPEGLIESDTAFLMANSKKFITLESRLADLLLGNFKVVFEIGDISRNDFPKVIAATRNYYIHYDEKIKLSKRVLTEDEIGVYNNALIIILEYYILREIGFMDRGIMEKLYERWGNISVILSVMKASQKAEKDISVAEPPAKE